MVCAADFAPVPDAAPAWAAIGDITAGCCVPPSPVWANAVNGEMRLDPVMAAMVGRGDGQTRDPLRGVNLFVWQCGEVIATGGEMLSLSHCAVPFLFRALSDWASECFPIEMIMQP